MVYYREDYDILLKAITGIIFLDVPNRGIDRTSLEPFIEFMSNKAPVRAFAYDEPWLLDLCGSFFGNINWNLDIVMFYAMQKSVTTERQKVGVSYRIYQVTH